MGLKFENRLYLAFRFALGGIFIWASLDKIIDPQGFARIIENYKLLPPIFIHPFALVLPWVELLCGINLVSGYLIKGSTMIINFLVVMFVIAIGVNMYRGMDIYCGCFSTSGDASDKLYPYLIRDGFLLPMGIWIFYFRRKQEKTRMLSLI